MPCHGCAANFSFFTKEQACPNCNFSYCNKCLKEKLIVGGQNQKVCSNCYKKLTDQVSSPAENFDPPAVLLKRLETLENPARPPITIFKQKGKLVSLKAGLDPEDRKIMERLEKLKEDRKVERLPSESEIKRRLLQLKGLSEENASEKSQVLQPPRKSEQEEVDDLLTQYMNEMVIEGKINEENKASLEEIHNRLKKLYDENIGQLSASGEEADAEDGDSVTKRIIEKAIAEGILEKKLEDSEEISDVDDDDDDDNDSIDPDDESEPQWCIICNQDASVKCLGCDKSLYCNTCFAQGHEFFKMEDHKTVSLSNEES